MQTIKTVIIDDEPLARSRVANRLKHHEEIKVIGECRNGAEAVTFLRRRKPELIFLDVQMPDIDGFEVLARVDLVYAPFIIFATAYDHYALKAFDVHAMDYLLKPFDNQRFHESIERAKLHIKLQRTCEFGHKLMDLVKGYQQEQAVYLDRFIVRKDGQRFGISTDLVYWLEANGNYVALHQQAQKLLYRATMNALESELDPARFLRIHRSCIINVDHLQKVQYLGSNEYQFRLANGEALLSGRSFKEAIVRFLGERSGE